MNFPKTRKFYRRKSVSFLIGRRIFASPIDERPFLLSCSRTSPDKKFFTFPRKIDCKIREDMV